jgi:outer membrane immunogenic protein
MKKLFLATTAFVALAAGSAGAADMTARPYTAAPPPAPIYTWTGMYWGANIGYSWGQSKNDRTLFGLGVTARESQDLDGVIGGVQTGYNYQFGAWVWGLETDIQASGQKGSAVIPVIPGATLTTDHKLQWFGTTRPRLPGDTQSLGVRNGRRGLWPGQGHIYRRVRWCARCYRDRERPARWLDRGRRHRRGIWGRLERKGRIPLCRPRQARDHRDGARCRLTANFNGRLTDNIVRVGLNYKWGAAGYGY